MASPNLTTECSAFPHFPVKRSGSYDVDVIVFEDDATQVIKVSDTKHSIIKLSYSNQDDTEKDAFEAFFDARQGPFGIFYWNDVRTGENDIKVRFVDKSVDYSANDIRGWSWTVSLRTVLS